MFRIMFSMLSSSRVNGMNCIVVLYTHIVPRQQFLLMQLGSKHIWLPWGRWQKVFAPHREFAVHQSRYRIWPYIHFRRYCGRWTESGDTRDIFHVCCHISPNVCFTSSCPTCCLPSCNMQVIVCTGIIANNLHHAILLPNMSAYMA